MNPRHAAAFALAGWYLMVPPTDDHQNPLTKAPLYQWEQIGVPVRDSAELDDPFLTLAEREARRTALKQSLLDQARDATGFARKMFLKFSDDAVEDRCVKSDDPRLTDPLTTELLK
jgi:hypothetical protein